MSGFTLHCPGCGQTTLDHFSCLCPACGPEGALVLTRYSRKQLELTDRPGLWKFSNWLPVQTISKMDHPGSVVYHARELGNELGLSKLFVAFNGWWPARGAFMKTGSFKELEAPTSHQRALETGNRGLVLASAGNTAAAFMSTVRDFPLELVVVVTSQSLEKIRIPAGDMSRVHLISLTGSADYLDAIRLSTRVGKALNIPLEGGVRNLARRDGIGTIVLESALAMKQIPDHCFQAIGSGTGAIAAFEMARRLKDDGRFGQVQMKLHLSQNLPFVPMMEAWKAKRRELVLPAEKEARAQIVDVGARMLTNRSPPYGLPGGVFDSLVASSGEMYGISNAEAVAAQALFQDSEGVDIELESGVTLASLLRAVENGLVDPENHILVNITGGGRALAREEMEMMKLEADLVFERDPDEEELGKELKGLF